MTPEPDAFERLRTLFEADPMAIGLGVRLIELGEGSAVVEGTITEQHVNFLGGGHGGMLFSLADIAMSFASNSFGRIAPALRVDISYMAPVAAGSVARATATTPKVTRRFGHHQLDVTVDGTLVAQATGTTYRTDDWHFGRDAWPEDWPHR